MLFRDVIWWKRTAETIHELTRLAPNGISYQEKVFRNASPAPVPRNEKYDTPELRPRVRQSMSMLYRKKETWQRIYTGEDLFIESNPSRMNSEPGQILRVKIQTVYSKPQSLRDQSGAKYKRVLETIDFKLNEKGYRINEIEWVDSDGQTVESHKVESADDWKMIKLFLISLLLRQL